MIEKLRALWHAYPDLRLGQLLENVAKHAGKKYRCTSDLFYIEDTELGFALEDASDTGLGSPFSTDPTAE